MQLANNTIIITIIIRPINYKINCPCIHLYKCTITKTKQKLCKRNLHSIHTYTRISYVTNASNLPNNLLSLHVDISSGKLLIYIVGHVFMIVSHVQCVRNNSNLTSSYQYIHRMKAVVSSIARFHQNLKQKINRKSRIQM